MKVNIFRFAPTKNSKLVSSFVRQTMYVMSLVAKRDCRSLHTTKDLCLLTTMCPASFHQGYNEGYIVGKFPVEIYASGIVTFLLFPSKKE